MFSRPPSPPPAPHCAPTAPLNHLAGFSCRVGALLAAATSHLPPLAPEPAPTGAMLRSGTSVFLCPLPYHRRHRVPSTLYHNSPPRSTHSPATTTTTYHTRPPPAATTHSPPPCSSPSPPLPTPSSPLTSRGSQCAPPSSRLPSYIQHASRERPNEGGSSTGPTETRAMSDPLQLVPCCAPALAFPLPSTTPTAAATCTIPSPPLSPPLHTTAATSRCAPARASSLPCLFRRSLPTHTHLLAPPLSRLLSSMPLLPLTPHSHPPARAAARRTGSTAASHRRGVRSVDPCGQA